MSKLAIPDWLLSDARTSEEIASDTKSRLADRLRETDRSVRVKFTEHFNHTFLPDMVLHWPRQNLSRLLYIRSTNRADWIAEDLSVLGKDQPLLVAIGTPLEAEDGRDSDEAQSRIAALSGVATTSGSSILSPQAIGVLAERSGRGPVDRIVNQVTLSGGRGLTNAAEATRVSEVSNRAFQAATASDPEGTAAGVALYDDMLNPAQANQMVRLLNAMWTGWGAADTAFPGQRSLGRLSASEIDLVLRTVEHGTPDFWTGIGHGLELADIEQLDFPERSAAFNELVMALLPNLQARAIGVRHDPPALIEEPGPPFWRVAGGKLEIRSAHWAATLGRKKSHALSDRPLSHPVTQDELSERAARGPVSLLGVNSEVGDFDLTVTSRSGESVDLNWIDSLPGASTAKITTAKAKAPGGATLTVDFLASVAAGLSLVDLPTLCRAGLSLLLNQADDDWPAAVSLLTLEGGEASGQERLALEVDELELGHEAQTESDTDLAP